MSLFTITRSAVKVVRYNFLCSNIKFRNLTTKQLIYCDHGEPENVVQLTETPVPKLGAKDVLVKMLAAPVNPADINTIQGKYPVKITLPAIPGNEGVGMVEEVGSDVKNLCPGNKVIVTKPVQGTWRELAVIDCHALRSVPNSIGDVEAATLTVNPCTAYRMLTDFVDIKCSKEPGVVIHNGANGACGQTIIQLCKAWNVNCISVVRNKPNIEEIKCSLKELGATFVLTEEELRTTDIFKSKQIKNPTLGLNCVGGKSSLEMLRLLQRNGKMITYGGMSRQPVSIPTSAFIFKNLSFLGFWMTRWNELASEEEKNKMFCDLTELIMQGKLVGPVHKKVKLDNYKEALSLTLSTEKTSNCKFIFDFSSVACL